ncbi:CHAT domain-containing protein [Lactococcus lactis]|uniref:CHAT domain-containing protein n=1 Tax=Lactococcus lactis TaxID=1358 RepID=UPI001F530EC8|nr:CHAT domain-containing protein [Lactococcus lactis]MCI1071874.1 CHAT domain-containing protein [Lactococcus lactis]
MITNKIDYKRFPKPEDFVFLCVTSNNHDEFFLKRDSLFNRFNSNIVEHTSSRFFISQLPKSLDELFVPWPFSTTIKGDYEIIYIRESLLNDGKSLGGYEMYNFGAIFIPDYISQDFIENLRKNTKLPIFSTEVKPNKRNVMPLNERALKEFYKKTFININGAFPEKYFNPQKILNKNYDKETGLSQIDIPEITILEPLKIMVNRLRGIYQDKYNATLQIAPALDEQSVDIREKEIQVWNEKYLKQLIIEKFITQAAVTSDGIDHLINHLSDTKALRESSDLGIDELANNYNYFIGKFEEAFDDLNFRTDMVFYLPILNKYVFDNLYNEIWKKEISKSVLGQIYKGGYGFGQFQAASGNNEKKEKNAQFYFSTMVERRKDNRVIDSLFVNYSLSKLIPYLRLPFVQAKDIYLKLNEIDEHVARTEEVLQIKKFNDNREEIGRIFENTISKKILKIISSKGKHIKFISDCPIEWIDNDGLPLYIEKSISRLPVMPGNGLVEHTYNAEFEIDLESTRILIVNSLNKVNESDKNLYQYGKALGTLCEEQYLGDKRKLCYFEPKAKDDFVQKIESFEPTILIYFGHGSHNSRDDEGFLNINEERFRATEIENLSWVPPIVILGACETQVPNKDYLNVGNCFFLAGATSVLATYFPVDGLFAFTFLESLFRNLMNVMRGEDLSGMTTPEYLKTWADVILQTRRSEYILEPLRAISGYLGTKKNRTSDENEIWGLFKDDGDQVLNFVMNYCFNRIDKDMKEAYKYRNEAYREFLKNNEKALKIFDKFIDSKYIFPESLIFTSLGSPEKIGIKKA